MTSGLKVYLLFASQTRHDRSQHAGDIPDGHRQSRGQLLAAAGLACLPGVTHNDQAQLCFIVCHASEVAMYSLHAHRLFFQV